MLRYSDERERLERAREDVRSSLAGLKKERRETKEELSTCQGKSQLLRTRGYATVTNTNGPTNWRRMREDRLTPKKSALERRS